MPNRVTPNNHSSVMRKNATAAANRARATDFFPDDVNDEIDVFNAQREQRLLGDVDAARGAREDGGESTRRVMAIDDDFDDGFDAYQADDAGDADADNGADDADADAGGDEADSNERADKAEHEKYLERITSNWGRQKTNYYNTDYAADQQSESEQEDALAEEAEVNRMEAKKAAIMLNKDFGLDEEPDGEAGATLADRATRPAAPGGAKTALSKADDALLRELNESIDDVAFATGAVSGTTQSVERDVSTMSAADKRAYVMRESPELIQLLDDFREMVNELRTRVEPVAARAREQRDGTGVSYLDVKLQAEGSSVREHPVIMQLVRSRTLLERLRPLDKKLGHQIDKLLKLSAAVDRAGDDAGALATASVDGAQARPRLRQLAPPGKTSAVADEHDDAEEQEDDDDADGDEDDDADDADDVDEAGDGVYRAPRISAVPYDDDKPRDKAARQAERNRMRTAQSALAKFVVDEYGDEPETVHDVSGGAYEPQSARALAAERERVQFEEDNFVRLMTTKKDKERRKKSMLRNELALLDDFTGVSSLDALTAADERNLRARPPTSAGGNDEDDGDDEQANGEPRRGKRSLSQLVSDLEQSSKSFARAHGAGGDGDADAGSDATRKRKSRDAIFDFDDDDFDDDNDDDDADADDDGAPRSGGKRSHVNYNDDALDGDNQVYARAKALARAERAVEKEKGNVRDAKRRNSKQAAFVADRDAARSNPTDDEREKRKASKKIVVNRGLVRSRSSKTKTPRNAMREKFDKAQQRRKGSVREAREAGGVYGGEASGVKSNVKRSRPLTR